MVKSESRANSLLALRALAWWGGVGGGREVEWEEWGRNQIH